MTWAVLANSYPVPTEQDTIVTTTSTATQSSMNDNLRWTELLYSSFWASYVSSGMVRTPMRLPLFIGYLIHFIKR